MRGGETEATVEAAVEAVVPGRTGAKREAEGGGTAPRRGRPRSEAAERSIRDAVVSLLEEGVPLGDISIERIARTAGVGKATIYRRWSDKEELFVDVLRDIEPPDPDLPGTSARDDLVVMLESVRLGGLAQRSSALLHNVRAQMKSHPKLWDAYVATVIDPRRVTVLEILRRAVAEGEIRADLDIDLVNDLIVGPMLVRAVMRPDAPLPGDLAERIVTAVLEGLRPRAV
ncbi:TetR/AcrR family transcriptional regulator [Streptomyces sp. NBC_01619]|uniref:TetR/AcrR family transcriptional regulator n=1 Tax=Streptomyces pratisoli TaxID=3139917 RepID=A0ACC6QEB2_9ACTN|nr:MULTISPECIES: TetR/AcrR family transcriptional regulator [unclassified Streptomyces]MCX4509431.1 TetR/AcrR family transcriptional regulator [Streptomyces sp. NBC_01619]